MISYDENGNTIKHFFNRYNEFKSSFSEFKKSIKSGLSDNNNFQITIENETERDITLEFIDREFLIEYSIVKIDGIRFLGRVTFSELLKGIDDEKFIIDQAYFDGHGNVKESPTAKHSDINLKNQDSSMHLLKFWFVKFIEGIEKAESGLTA